MPGQAGGPANIWISSRLGIGADAIMSRMDATDNLVDIRGLRFAYGRRQVLRGVDLAIPRGSVVAILGTTGSGKTTLLQLMGGSLRPAAGKVSVCGHDVHALSRHELYALRRRMGMMFQKGGCSATSRYSRTSPSRYASTRGCRRA